MGPGTQHVLSQTRESKAYDNKGPSSSSTASVKRRPNSTLKRLTQAKIIKRREQGMCFKCDERFSPGHICKSRLYQTMVLREVESDQETEEAELEKVEEEQKEEDTPMELSMNSIVGINGNDTMKVRGKLKGNEVVILIDSRATDNFISSDIVQRLQIPVTTTRSYNVSVGDGYSVRGNQKCINVELEVQGLPIKQTFYVFDMRGADLVLGIDWLKSLGEVRVDWGRLTMIVKTRTGEKCLRGDPSLSKIIISLKTMMRTLQGGDRLLHRVWGNETDARTRVPHPSGHC